jgi:Ribosomal protein L10
MSVQAINEKKKIVAEISEKFNAAQSAVVVEYRGLNVAQITELRRKLRAENIDFKVYKNKMVQRAADDLGYSELNNSLVGPNAIAFGTEDAVAPARVLVDFAKKNKDLVVKGAMVEGRVVDETVVKELASLPDRDGMYSMLLSCLQAPIKSFAYAVKAVSEKEESTDESVAIEPTAEEVVVSEAE